MQFFSMKRAAVQVYVSAVRNIVDGDDLGTEPFEEGRRKRRRGAVRAINYDFNSPEREGLTNFVCQVVELT